MFRVGEKAFVRENPTTQVQILSLPVTGNRDILTTGGVFQERELHPSTPEVLNTIKAFRASYTPPKEQKPYEKRPSKSRVTLLRRKLRKLPLDLQGHYASEDRDYGKNISREVFDVKNEIYLGWVWKTHKGTQPLLEALSPEGAPLENPSLLRRLSHECWRCGKHLKLETNGKVVRVAGEPCKYPLGYPNTQWELNVPSGKIVVANDLREIFPLPRGEGSGPCVNFLAGRENTTLMYAAQGLAHANVGNSCPGVYSLGEGKFKIAKPAPEERWDKRRRTFVSTKAPPMQGERIAWVCTDLWWYSICDFEEYLRRHAKFTPERALLEGVAIRPGVYKFTHYDRSDGGEGETLFSTFEWVREPDPVQNLLEDWDSVEVNPHAYVQAQVLAWPTLYGHAEDEESAKPWSEFSEEERLSTWASVADHIFCTIGGGTDWHQKGFPTCSVDPSIPDIPPPKFRNQFSWYPFAHPYGGMFLEGFSEPFLKLLFEVLESNISFGLAVQDYDACRDVEGGRRRMALALKRYRELDAKHPGVADPIYSAWVGDGDRADEWVKNFDLGPKYTKRHEAHLKMQEWVPENTYAIKFDARKLSSGSFCLDPKVMAGWASKENAQKYALVVCDEAATMEGAEHEFWSTNATKAVPLCFIARIVAQRVSSAGDRILEIQFDYGCEKMLDKSIRRGIKQYREKDACSLLTKEDYDCLLPEVKKLWDDLQNGTVIESKEEEEEDDDE